MPQTNIKSLVMVSLIAICFAGCDQLKVENARESVRLDGETAAIVNGEPLYALDVELEAVAQGLIAPGTVFSKTHEQYQLVLDQLVDQRLLAQEATLRNLDLDDNARHRLNIARERILGNLLVESLVASAVTEDAIQEMYNEQAHLQQLDDEVRISLITVSDEATAESLIQEHGNGAEFSALAFKYSTDASTRIEGGDLGYIGPTEQPEPFSSVIANTPVGQISSAFQTDTAWHVLKVEDRRQKPPKTLEQMRPEIVTFLTYAQINKILKELRAQAVISAHEANPPIQAGTEEPAGEENGTPDPSPVSEPQEDPN